jgi:glycosyltransferase involved in cell wall biosynthesis
VPVDDPVAFAGAANRLLTEPGLRDRLAAAARTRATCEFDHRTMAERSLAIYRRILANERGTNQRANKRAAVDLGQEPVVSGP